jgi:hypothetical protein
VVFVNEHLRKALLAFFGEVITSGDVREKAKDAYRLLGGDLANLEEAPEEPADDPEPPADDPNGDQG